MASISAFAQQAEADGFGVSAGFDINIPYKDSYDQRFGVLIFEPNIDAPSISTCSYYPPLDYIMSVTIATNS